MPQVLFVHSSTPTGELKRVAEGFCTLKMARAFKERIKGRNVRMIDRNISATPPGMIDADFIAAANTVEQFRTPQQVQRLKESDELVSEVLKSDVIVIGCPIYSSGMPAPLKAWADNIVRPGRTFVKPGTAFKNQSYGLLHDKMVVLLEAVKGKESNVYNKGRSVRYSDEMLANTFSKLGVRNLVRIAVTDLPDNDSVENMYSWTMCETSLNDLAERVKLRWKMRYLDA